MKILVLQHHDDAPAGHVGRHIETLGGTLDIRKPHHGDQLPEDDRGHDGLLMLGGAISVNDDVTCPHYRPLMALAREMAAKGKPVMGICLGAQLLARAFGGRVYEAPIPEFGFKKLWLTDEGKADPVFTGLAPEQHVMEFHYETFDLPPGAVRVMTGPDCENQAFRLGRTVVGFQCHPEVTVETVRNWARLDVAQRCAQGEDPVALAEKQLAEGRQERSAAFARAVTERWLDLA
jgi:GMP synthase-like glutamine amidotransferase